MEYQLVDFNNLPDYAYPEWFEKRESVHHLSRKSHKPRLKKCAEIINEFVPAYEIKTVVDVGCGDGGLLSLLDVKCRTWGYEVRRDDIEQKRPGTDVRYANVDRDMVILKWGRLPNLVVCTEMLEHLINPHWFLERLKLVANYILVSSPHTDTPERHMKHHLWGWDREGYQKLVRDAGFLVIGEYVEGWSQILVAERR